MRILNEGLMLLVPSNHSISDQGMVEQRTHFYDFWWSRKKQDVQTTEVAVSIYASFWHAKEVGQEIRLKSTGDYTQPTEGGHL